MDKIEAYARETEERGGLDLGDASTLSVMADFVVRGKKAKAERLSSALIGTKAHRVADVLLGQTIPVERNERITADALLLRARSRRQL